MAPGRALCENRPVRIAAAMPHDVFLSYASSDRAAAEAVCAALEARGIRVWMAPRNVPAGADWGEAILTAIGRAHAMVLVLSRNTAGSVHVRNEVVTAVSQSLAVVPVRIEDCQPGGALRLHLAGAHWLNVFPPPVERHADALAAGVRLALAADATIELPREQAAALVAAARAAARPSQPAASPPQRPAAPAPPVRPRATAVPASPAAPGHAPAVPVPGKGRGIAVAIGLAVLLAALGGAAWVFQPQWRAMLGTASPPPGAMADAQPDGVPPPAAPQAAVPGAAAPPRTLTPAPPVLLPAAPARLMNLASETISRLFVAVAQDGIGQEDWLGSAQITPGNAVLLRPPPGQGCVFNIRVVYVGGRTEDRPGVDLCAAPELRFEGSKSAASSSR